MSKKKKGRYTLSEAIDLLEATWSRGYPDDGTGVAGDDDRPPGNIVYGEKYKRTPYFNKLTDFQDSWEVDLDDWTWDEFEMSGGMEDIRNYSNTLQGMKDLFPDDVWKRIWAKMKYVSPEKVNKGFDDAGQHWRTANKSQTGGEKEDHVEIDAEDDGAEFRDAKVTNEKITKKIDTFIV